MIGGKELEGAKGGGGRVYVVVFEDGCVGGETRWFERHEFIVDLSRRIIFPRDTSDIPPIRILPFAFLDNFISPLKPPQQLLHHRLYNINNPISQATTVGGGGDFYHHQQYS